MHQFQYSRMVTTIRHCAQKRKKEIKNTITKTGCGRQHFWFLGSLLSKYNIDAPCLSNKLIQKTIYTCTLASMQQTSYMYICFALTLYKIYRLIWDSEDHFWHKSHLTAQLRASDVNSVWDRKINAPASQESYLVRLCPWAPFCVLQLIYQKSN